MKKEMSAVIKHGRIGDIHVKWDDGRLLVTGINLNEPFGDAEYGPESFMRARFPELYRYLARFGKKDLSYPIECLDFSWAPPFYRLVYKKLASVGFGKTVSYGGLAEMAGRPKACRAVGTAMRKNRYPLAVPCHRVTGKNSLGGFACGMDMKKILLRLEGRTDLAE